MTYRSIGRDTPLSAMLKVFGTTVLALAMLLGLRATASAQTLCSTHEEITDLLDSRYSEAQVAIGIANNGGLIEVFSAGDGATWTIVMTTPQGKSCVVANGGEWYMIEEINRDPEA